MRELDQWQWKSVVRAMQDFRRNKGIIIGKKTWAEKYALDHDLMRVNMWPVGHAEITERGRNFIQGYYDQYPEE